MEDRAEQALPDPLAVLANANALDLEAQAEHLGHEAAGLSPAVTVVIAFVTAMLTFRLLRELSSMLPSGAREEPGQGAGERPPGAVTFDAPGIPPFRPFSGQSYKLSAAPEKVAEAEVSTPASASSNAPPAEPPQFGEPVASEVPAAN